MSLCGGAGAETRVVVMGDRCSGHCCERFWLPYDYQTFKEKAETIQDGVQIADMLIPLDDQSHPSECVDRADLETGAYYRCRHLTENGDCGIYETRPRMCSGYPYARLCLYRDCTWSIKKANLPVIVGGIR